MNIWKAIYLGLICANLGIFLAKDGEPRTGTYEFMDALIATLIQVWILYKGGFF